MHRLLPGRSRNILFIGFMAWAALASAQDKTATSRTAANRTTRLALRYLQTEVPSWSSENKCFSCHNNGDGARALYTAIRLSHQISAKSVSDSTDWLTRPRVWKDNGGQEQFSDKRLAANNE